jgi:phage recombination protein Bet
MNTVAKIETTRPSLIVAMAGQYQMDPAQFAKTVRATCMPGTASDEEFAAFLMVAKQYDLNPVTREIYAFPKKGGGIQPIVGIDGWMNLINSHPACDGMEFKDEFDAKGALVSITAMIHRKDRKHATMVTEYMSECRRPTEPWTKWPARMLRHKAAIQCARYAFGFAGIIDPEEAERSPEVITGEVTAPPPPAVQIAAPKPVEVVEEVTDIEVEPLNVDKFLDDLDTAILAATDDALLIEVWDSYDVEATLTHDDSALQRAFDLRKKHEAELVAAMTPADEDFPGDK